MNLSQIRERLQDLYGSTLVSDDTFYDRIINDSYRDLAALGDWWWLESHEILRFSAPVTAITVVASADATTLDAAPSADALGTAYSYGWLSTDDYTYRLEGVSTSAYAIDAAWIGGSATSTVQIWNDMLTLPSDFDHIISLAPRNEPSRKPLSHVEYEDIEAFGHDVASFQAEVADRFAVFRDTAYFSADFRLRIFPPPDQVAEYLCRYILSPGEMTTATATTLIPGKHEGTLVALSRLNLARICREDSDVIQSLAADVADGVSRMIRDQRARGGMKVRMKLRGTIERIPQMFRLVNVEAGGI